MAMLEHELMPQIGRVKPSTAGLYPPPIYGILHKTVFLGLALLDMLLIQVSSKESQKQKIPTVACYRVPRF